MKMRIRSIWLVICCPNLPLPVEPALTWLFCRFGSGWCYPTRLISSLTIQKPILGESSALCTPHKSFRLACASAGTPCCPLRCAIESAHPCQHSGRVSALSGCGATRPSATPVAALLAFRVEDAHQLVSMRGVVHCGAVDIAEKRLLGVQRFDLRIEFIYGGGVRENGD